jgi:hemerythrin-like domain-containing protein
MHEVLFDALRKDHRRFQQLLRQMLNAGAEGKVKEQHDLLSTLTSELLQHMYGEESGLYRMLKEHEESKLVAHEGFEEHHIARIVLDELRGLSPSEESFEGKAKVLSDLADHHIEEEEEELFEKAEDVLSHEEAGQVLEIFKSEKHVEHVGTPHHHH